MKVKGRIAALGLSSKMPIMKLLLGYSRNKIKNDWTSEIGIMKYSNV